MNWNTQPITKLPRPMMSQPAVVAACTSVMANAVSTPLTTAVARPSARLPRVRYQSVLSAHSTMAAFIGAPAAVNSARASRALMAKTISGMPMKCVAMLRRSRW